MLVAHPILLVLGVILVFSVRNPYRRCKPLPSLRVEEDCFPPRPESVRGISRFHTENTKIAPRATER